MDHAEFARPVLIDGLWRTGESGRSRPVIDPATGQTLVVLDDASTNDARAAVRAARRAFDDGTWSAVSAQAERCAVLRRTADVLLRDRETIAEVETLDTGKTLAEARIDVADVVAVLRYYADLAERPGDRVVDVGDPAVLSRVVREPAGVCVAIAPWNYPLLQMSWKVAPALAAGCTTVLKPSEVTPLSTVLFARALQEAGAPAGVVNLVHGSGAEVGAALTADPDVDLVSFTGGAATGTTILQATAPLLTRVALELGGKNPHVVFADAAGPDRLDATVDRVLTGVFLHSGQVCSAGTRLIVEESVADRVVDEVVRRAEAIVLGPGLEPSSEAGPLVSTAHREAVQRYVDGAIAEGAVLRCGGEAPTDPRLVAGSFYRPTVLDRCDREMTVVREETFGPVLTVERFVDEAEALRLANDTRYGLAAGVAAADPSRAERMARGLRHGTVWVNDFGPYTPAAEWGGFGRSGHGRELGPSGLHEYQQLKHVWTHSAAPPAGWFGRGSDEQGSEVGLEKSLDEQNKP
ncbi:aldehyde dehydrogenase family protein [Rhodococcoides corynebacterioides]|uniref:Aldehyde dehydrogenase family protein n=1 Tax=Rhodococcoides corynebacterioides TaxID=53972 RepID=A0ABS7P4R1_9NOCA|nr:aldehyde dehydrogenase family protein [Rhodococcus corynebacterioides]MBY6407626.1 aldehyde dehydrogenase family protein [Rhodococcus corynebacterioides]